jgi:hypothetical protein
LAAGSVDDLDIFMRSVINQEPWDIETSLVAMPWKRVKGTKEITVGIMWDDGYVLSNARSAANKFYTVWVM